MTNKRLTDCLENLISYNTAELFSTRTFRYEKVDSWANLPISTNGGLTYYFNYLEDMAELTFLGTELNGVYSEHFEAFKSQFTSKIENEFKTAKSLNLKNDKQIKAYVTERLLDGFFLQIEFLIKNSFIDSFLKNKARSGKQANFGQSTLGRFEADIDSQIEKKLIFFISETIDALSKGVKANTTTQNNDNITLIIDYNTLINQYLSLQMAQSLNLLNARSFVKLISRHGNANVEVIWPPKPLKRKKANNGDEDQEVDAKDDLTDDDTDRPSPEPIEIFSYFYPAQPNLPITVLSQISKVKNLVFFLKYHTQFKFNSLLDAFACDHPEANNRFSLRYSLFSYFNNARLNLITLNHERKWQNSLTVLYKGANWLEREVWDLFGIYFDKHPDLRRILTDYGFMGHPLRKDFPVHGFIDVRYCEISKSLLYTPTKLMAGWKAQDSLFNKALW